VYNNLIPNLGSEPGSGLQRRPTTQNDNRGSTSEPPKLLLKNKVIKKNPMDNNFRQGSTDALPIGYLLHWYELLEVIGRGGYGITYLAMDRNLQRKVAVKEYLPLDFACRDSTDTVNPITKNHRELFDWGLQRFLVEARTLAKFNHPAIIRVVSVFEHNKTAYMVMEYEEGDDLAIHYMENAPLTEEHLLKIFVPIIEGLGMVHDANFIHRDIKPSNIYVRHDGSSVLLDFGSARQTIGSRTRALTSLVTAGYAPFEQYNESDDAQGAWTDIYGLGATMYFCMTGAKPADAMERGSALLRKKNDIYQPLSYMADLPYSDTLKLAVDHALMFHVEDRPANALQWIQMLKGQVELAPLPMEQVDTTSVTTPYEPDAQGAGRPTTGPATQLLSGLGKSGQGMSGQVKSEPVSAPATSYRHNSQVQQPVAEEDDDSTRIDYRPRRPGSVTNPPNIAARTAPPTTSIDHSAEQDEPDLTYLAQPVSKRPATKATPTTPLTTPPQRSAARSGPGAAEKFQAVLSAIATNVQKALQSTISVCRTGLQKLIQYVQTHTRLVAAGAGGIVVIVLATVVISSMSGNEAATQPGQDQAAAVPQQQQTAQATQPSTEAQQPTQINASQPGAAQTPNHKLDIQQATAELVQSLLAQAKIDIANNQIVTPENNNAVYRYQKVLAIQPDNQQARQALADLAQRYADSINTTMDEGAWQQAQQQVDDLKQMTKDSAIIDPLQARIQEHDKQLKIIASNLQTADKYLKQNRLIYPDKSNALTYYTKVLELDPDNQHASEGVNQIVAKLSDNMNKQIAAGKISSAEKLFRKIEAIDPNAESLKQAESNFASIAKKRKTVTNLVKAADKDFIRGNLIGSNSAFSKYQEVLHLSPNNKGAMEGLKRVHDYYVSSYNQYVSETRFDKAEGVLATLRKIGYGDKQIDALKNNIKQEQQDAKNEPETIKLMLSQLAKGLKNKDLPAIAKMSSFETKDEQYLTKIFDKYRSFSVKIMQTDHDLSSHHATANIKLSDFVLSYGEAWPTDKKEIKLDIQVNRNKDKQWKIMW